LVVVILMTVKQEWCQPIMCPIPSFAACRVHLAVKLWISSSMLHGRGGPTHGPEPFFTRRAQRLKGTVLSPAGSACSGPGHKLPISPESRVSPARSAHPPVRPACVWPDTNTTRGEPKPGSLTMTSTKSEPRIPGRRSSMMIKAGAPNIFQPRKRFCAAVREVRCSHVILPPRFAKASSRSIAPSVLSSATNTLCRSSGVHFKISPPISGRCRVVAAISAAGVCAGGTWFDHS